MPRGRGRGRRGRKRGGATAAAGASTSASATPMFDGFPLKMKEETTTMEKMQYNASMNRIRSSTTELLALMDDPVPQDGEGRDEWWHLMESNINLKSTFLYCELSKVISLSDEESNQFLTNLANALLACMEQLGNAVKAQSISDTQDRYNDTVPILQELMASIGTS